MIVQKELHKELVTLYKTLAKVIAGINTNRSQIATLLSQIRKVQGPLLGLLLSDKK